MQRWKDDICSTFVDLDCEEVESEQFFGEVVTRRSDELQFSFVTSTTQRVVRSASRIAKSPEDCFLLALQVAGTGAVKQNRREAFQSPGDFTIYDTTAPYELRFEEDFRQFIVRIPREQFLQRVRFPEDAMALTFSHNHGPVRLATRYLTELARECSGVPGAFKSISNSVALDLIAFAMTARAPTDRLPSQRNGHSLTLQRILYYIRDNLGDPGLTPTSIAQAHGISVRYLSMIFKGSPLSVDRTIWQQRLEHCARDLVDPAQISESITNIAFSRGFNDSAHFSRSFRAHFGRSPREYRQTNLAKLTGKP